MNSSLHKIPIIIGLAGGTSCGKTQIIREVIEMLDGNVDQSDRNIRIIHLDMQSFYIELNEEDRKMADEGKYNFDHPDVMNFEKCADTLHCLIEGQSVDVASYDTATNSIKGYETIQPADVIMIEGSLLFHDEKVRNLLSIKIYVKDDSEVCLNARLQKFVKNYNRCPLAIIKQYTDFVKPAFEEFCLPTKKYADVIIPRGGTNKTAVTFISVDLRETFRKFGANKSIFKEVNGNPIA